MADRAQAIGLKEEIDRPRAQPEAAAAIIGEPGAPLAELPERPVGDVVHALAGGGVAVAGDVLVSVDGRAEVEVGRLVRR